MAKQPAATASSIQPAYDVSAASMWVSRVGGIIRKVYRISLAPEIGAAASLRVTRCA